MSVEIDNWELTRKTIGDGVLSVVMPFYRLASAAQGNLKAVADLFEEHRIKAQLVPVDDGSGDGTDSEFARLNEDWKYEYVSFSPVVSRRNSGKGAALRAGFEASTGEFVMLLDGDLDINPMQTPVFFRSMVENKADIVIGSKRHRNSDVQYPWHRRIVSWCYFTLVKIFVGLPVTDTQTGMKLFRREVLGEALARMLVKTYAFDLELLSIAHSRGAKIAEAPVVIRFGQKFGAL
jgi:glycosyltransferase involved in cell wall biosynthesis